MNTDQIQALAARVAALEAQVAELARRVEQSTAASAILRSAGLPWQAAAADERRAAREARHLKAVQ